MTALAERLAELIHREGPVPFDHFVDEALYGEGGFFTRSRGAGRAGADFVTSPEVGPLYGALVAREVDRLWDELGAPDPFAVVDAGAGRGRLAADLLAAAPACSRALRLLLVERSTTLREAQRELLVLEPPEDALGPSTRAGDDEEGQVTVPVAGMGPIVASLGDLPATPLTGVVLANELLDNLPCRIVERADEGWLEVRVGHAVGGFVEVPVPATPEVVAEADRVAPGGVPVGTQLPVPTGTARWLRDCAAALTRGFLVVVDYAAPVDELVARGTRGWLRTYRGHERGESPLVALGEQDITCDLPSEYLVDAARRAGLTLVRELSQREWLEGLGVADLVADARAAWAARAHVGDLEAVRHRSRVSEADALLDPSGLGAHRVFVFAAARFLRSPG
jgi:SAM-dependent MidA family methyltransferase